MDFLFGTVSCRRCEFHIWDSTAEFGWNAEAGESGRCSAVCVCFVWTPTVSGIWRIGTVIWAALCVSHKQMKAQSLKVRLISLSQLHREYCEYGEGFYSLRGSKGRLLSSLSSTYWKKNGLCTAFVSINIHSFILRPGSWDVDKQGTVDGPEIHFIWNWVWN